MNMKKSILLFALLALVRGTFAAVTPGTINTNFSSSLSKAEKENLPLVVIWGNTSCGYCNKLSNALETSTFEDYLEARDNLLVVHKHEAYESKATDYLAAKEWIESIQKLSGYPYVAFYWKKADGTVIQKAFIGRNGKMPGSVTKGKLEKQLISAIDTVLFDEDDDDDDDDVDDDDVENSPSNPHWVGEYTAKALPYGEWTMDFDTAKSKVASQGGTLLAMFAGPLWCPNCQTMDRDVLSTTSFKTWAKKNKLVLVLFDQGHASSPSTPQGTSTGRLLTTVPSTYTGLSGASYLARHGIDPNSWEVQKVINSVTTYTSKWLAPESTAARLGNPTILLLNKAGTEVVARYMRQRYDTYSADTQENLYRLKDLLTLAGTSEDVSYRSTTPLTLSAGETTKADFHINRRTYVWKLEDLNLDEYLSIKASSTDKNAQDITLALYRNMESAALLTGRNRLVLDEPLSSFVDEGDDLYVVATSYGDDSSAYVECYGSENSFTASISLRMATEQGMNEVKNFTKAELKAMNAKLCTKQSALIPIYSEDDGEGSILLGTLTVAQSTANRLSAKFAGSKTLSFSGAWQEISETTGLVTTMISNKSGTLSLTMDAEGAFTAAITNLGEGRGTTAAATAFTGAYTVTLLPEDEDAAISTMTIKVTNKGKATVSGFINGTTVSGSSTLCMNDDGSATLPIYRTTSAGTLSLALRLKPNAAQTWGNAGSMSTVTQEDGITARWTAKKAGALDFAAIYGGYWKANTTALAACEDFDAPSTLLLTLGGDEIGEVKATKNGFSFTKGTLKSLALTRSTGKVTGKATLKVDGKSVSASLTGVVLPGWYDCGCNAESVFEQPFASGTVTYKAGKVTVTTSFTLTVVK